MEKYTTEDKIKADPIKEKDKIVISNDAYSLVDSLIELSQQINNLRKAAL